MVKKNKTERRLHDTSFSNFKRKMLKYKLLRDLEILEKKTNKIFSSVDAAISSIQILSTKYKLTKEEKVILKSKREFLNEMIAELDLFGTYHEQVWDKIATIRENEITELDPLTDKALKRK